MCRLRSIFLALAVSAAALAQQKVTFSTEDGARVCGDAYGKGRRGVVLVHGGRFTKESWRAQAEVLVKAGFRVLAIDLRGYGCSTRPVGAGPEDPYEKDVLGAVRYLRGHGARTVSVVGGSMGGAAAGDASVVGRPREIDRVVILGAETDQPAEKMKSRVLFIVAREDSNGAGPRLPGIRAQFEKAPEPKELIVLEGSAHAQFLFQTEQGDRVMREIVRFLSAE